MPRRTDTAVPPTPQKVNVSVDMPQTAAPATEVKEEKSPSWFWDMLQDIPREKWGAEYDVMGWRVDPKPGVTPGGKGFLFLIAEPITPMWIKQNYGGGKFRCILQKNSRFKTSHEFEIEGQPKYDLTREVPNVPANSNGNADFQKEFISVLREELQRSRENPQSSTQGTDEVVRMLTSASEKAMEIVTKQTPNAGSSTQQLSELINIVKGLLPQPSGGGVVETIKVLKELGLIGQSSDPMAQITTFLTIFEKIDAIRGAGGGDGKPKDWRAMLAEGAVQKAPEILKEIREIVTENKETASERRRAAEQIRHVEELRRTPPGATPNVTVPANGGTATTVMPASGPLRTVPLNRGEGAPAETATPAPVTTAPPAAPGMSASETDAVANFMQRRIVEMVNDERDAEDVVDFIEEIDPTMNDLLAQFSPEMVTTFLADKPIIGDATRHPKWNAFLVTAQKYIKQIRAEDAAIDAVAHTVPA